MRKLTEVFVVLALLTNQAAYAAEPVKTQVSQPVIVGALSLDTSDPRAVSAKVIKPDFEAEVLVPLRSAQEAKAKAEALAAAKAEAARLAAIAAANAARAAAQVRPVATRPGATGPLNNAQITFLGNCESGMTANRNSGNGFYGAFQFTIPTWNAMATGYARADYAPLDVQIDAVQRLLTRSSIFTQFPGCARQMQARGLL